jgi:hypothetical protein
MKLFGSKKREIWKALSDELGGAMHSSWRGDKVQVVHEDWVITLDTYVVMANNAPIFFTRIRAPFVNRSEFRFSIWRRNVFSDLANWLGAQDVEIGDAAFDQAFVLKSNNEPRLLELLRDEELRRLLDAQPTLSLSVKDDEGWFGAKFTEHVDELYFSVAGVITDLDRLKELFELFSYTLDRLVITGSAEPIGPAVEL